MGIMLSLARSHYWGQWSASGMSSPWWESGTPPSCHMAVSGLKVLPTSHLPERSQRRRVSLASSHLAHGLPSPSHSFPHWSSSLKLSPHSHSLQLFRSCQWAPLACPALQGAEVWPHSPDTVFHVLSPHSCLLHTGLISIPILQMRNRKDLSNEAHQVLAQG